MTRKLKNYTTQVPANRSIAEIQDMLQRGGATGILLEYEKGGTGRIKELCFKMELEGNTLMFRLPLRLAEAKKAMQDQGITRASSDDDYVYRVAWRILKDWVDIQMTILELNMVEMVEIFLPYAVRPNGQTIFEALKENPQFLLGTGKEL